MSDSQAVPPPGAEDDRRVRGVAREGAEGVRPLRDLAAGDAGASGERRREERHRDGDVCLEEAVAKKRCRRGMPTHFLTTNHGLTKQRTFQKGSRIAVAPDNLPEVKVKYLAGRFPVYLFGDIIRVVSGKADIWLDMGREVSVEMSVVVDRHALAKEDDFIEFDKDYFDDIAEQFMKDKVSERLRKYYGAASRRVNKVKYHELLSRVYVQRQYYHIGPTVIETPPWTLLNDASLAIHHRVQNDIQNPKSLHRRFYGR